MFWLRNVEVVDGLVSYEKVGYVEAYCNNDPKNDQKYKYEIHAAPRHFSDGKMRVWKIGISSKSNRVLVELPMEAVDGSRRIWVDKNELIEDKSGYTVIHKTSSMDITNIS